jgi:hypothetical protein
MIRKSIIAIVMCVSLLFLLFTLVSAQEPGKEMAQMDMSTPTAALPSVESTAVPQLPLSNTQSGTGTCPMMGGMDMTGSASMPGMGMSGMTGMQGMSGMNMGNMAGMQGMQNMPGGMMNMGNMNGPMAAYAAPWYSNPWLMLGWVLLTLVVLSVLAGIVLTVQTLRRRSEAVVPVDKS